MSCAVVSLCYGKSFVCVSDHFYSPSFVDAIKRGGGGEPLTTDSLDPRQIRAGIAPYFTGFQRISLDFSIDFLEFDRISLDFICFPLISLNFV